LVTLLDIMKRAAIFRCLMIAVIAWAVLFLPWGSLIVEAAQPAGCPYCHAARIGIVSGHSCCPTDKADSSGPCGQKGMSICHCSFGMPAFIAPSNNGTPAWWVALHVIAMTTEPKGIFSPHIFRPPESNSSFFQA
jgi:hypothetical protein